MCAVKFSNVEYFWLQFSLNVFYDAFYCCFFFCIFIIMAKNDHLVYRPIRIHINNTHRRSMGNPMANYYEFVLYFYRKANRKKMIFRITVTILWLNLVVFCVSSDLKSIFTIYLARKQIMEWVRWHLFVKKLANEKKLVIVWHVSFDNRFFRIEFPFFVLFMICVTPKFSLRSNY